MSKKNRFYRPSFNTPRAGYFDTIPTEVWNAIGSLSISICIYPGLYGREFPHGRLHDEDGYLAGAIIEMDVD